MRSLIRWLPRNSREDWIRKWTTRRNGGWFCFAPIFGQLPTYSDPGNLVAFLYLRHTRFTYHRTWETGLGAETSVAVANPAFFCSSAFWPREQIHPTGPASLRATIL